MKKIVLALSMLALSSAFVLPAIAEEATEDTAVCLEELLAPAEDNVTPMAPAEPEAPNTQMPSDIEQRQRANAATCSNWYYVGCCTYGIKLRRNCQWGSEYWSEYKCQGTTCYQ